MEERDQHRYGAVGLFVLGTIFALMAMHKALYDFEVGEFNAEVYLLTNILIVLMLMCGGFIGFILMHKKE